jgi:septal ring factor EnvC (AmiA/AmiB activator)
LEHKVHLLRSQIKEARQQRDSLHKELERAAEEKATLASALAESEKPKVCQLCCKSVLV